MLCVALGNGEGRDGIINLRLIVLSWQSWRNFNNIRLITASY